MSETVDAARALESIDVADEPLFRSALCATLVKSGDHLDAFDAAYEIFFATRHIPGESELDASHAPPGSARPGATDVRERSASELAEQLFGALRDNDMHALRASAAEAVARYAGIEAGRPVGGAYYLYR